MNAIRKNFLPLSTLAAAVLATVGTAVAAENEELTELTKPGSKVSLGIGHVSKDNQRFGQYTGLNEDGVYGLVDVDIVQRDEATGTWLMLNGRNLGFDNRELRFEHERQSDWGYFIDLSQTPRFDPYTVTTTLTGIGTTTQTVAGSATAQPYHLKTERDTVTLGFNKEFTSNLGLQVRFRNEEKDGERLWGQGTFGTWRFLTDPIDQTTRQIDATLNYTTEKLQLTGGYYGTAFENRNNVLNVPGCAIFTGCDQMGLPPDNESHQLHLAGGYNFSKMTRGTFKFAVGRITQNEAYATTPVAGAPGSLDGRIDTTLVQAGLTARPMPKLSLRADVRYEDRDDKTPVFVYFPSNFATPTTATSDGTNEPRDIKTTAGKFEASYQMPMDFRLTGGLDYVEKTRNSPPVRSVSFRETTEETSVRAELRRSISETLTGALSYIHSNRGGSEWLVSTFVSSATFATSSNQIAPLHLADRDRDMWRLTFTWMPIDPLSLNLRLDQARDEYSGRGFGVVDQAVRKGKAENYSLDAAYSFTNDVQGTAWYSVNDTALESVQCRSSNGDVCTPGTQQVWGSDVQNLADSFGLGLRAKLNPKLELSADVYQSKVRDEIELSTIAGTSVTPIDDVINTKVTSVKLSAKYALQRNSGVRAMYIYDRYRTDDWTWANWNYSPADGGTTVLQEPVQKVNFFGVSYFYRWR
ncbi:MAG: MtrB/PioB family decaheme-associated outer membrane protein [Sulfuricaulis sp.]|nr:MtrB/PioB family decaheme-associated outer membrane protein [Sulfuricaulis sp.]